MLGRRIQNLQKAPYSNERKRNSFNAISLKSEVELLIKHMFGNFRTLAVSSIKCFKNAQ